MNWEQRISPEANRPHVAGAVGGVVALGRAGLRAAIRWLDRETGWTFFRFGPEGARAILGMLAGSMLTFIVFVLSATLIVVQLASGQLTPRIITLVLTTPGVKFALGSAHLHLHVYSRRSRPRG